jgi:hypothetical protein
MAKKRRTPEEREEIRRLLAQSDEARRELETAYAGLKARRKAADERRARRRRLLRWLIPFAR